MALSGFLVPALTGAFIERQRIADSYDEKAGEIIDTVAPKYNEQLDINQKEIALHKTNYDAVASVLGIPVAEAASKGGFLTNVDTAKVVNHVQASLKDFIEWVGDKDIETIQKEYPDAYQSLFSDNYAQAKSSLKEKRNFAATNFNKGAIKNVSDLYLGKKDEEPTKVESAQKFLFGDRITDETGSAYEQAVAQKLGDPITIKSDNAAFSLLREYYSEIGAQGKTFENMDDMLFHGYQQIMKWNARTGENFFGLESERQNEIGTMILPKIGSPQLYEQIENKWLNDPIMQKFTTELYLGSAVWMKIQESLILAHNLGHRKDDGKGLPDEIKSTFANTAYADIVKDYNSLLQISNSLDDRFESVIKKAMEFSKDIAPGDPDKQAEIVGKLYTDLGFNDNLVVGDINPDNNSGILGTFITPSTAVNPKGIKMYIYRGTNGKYWGIPVDPEFRMRPPLPLLEEQVNKILNQ